MVREHLEHPVTFTGVVIVLALWAAVLFRPLLPELEGKLFPIVENARVTSYVPVPDDPHATIVWGVYDQVRDCGFRRIEWYLGTPETGTLLGLERDEQFTRREIGEKIPFGPWKIFVPPSQLIETSALVVYSCHAFWDTVMVFRSPLD